MFLLLWSYVDGEAADHMITKKNSQLLYPYFATYMVLYDTCNYCIMYVHLF